VPHLIASHNIEAQIWQRRAAISRAWVARPYFRLQAARMRRFERRAFARARAVTTVSAEDRATALGWGASRSSLVANGVDLDYFQPRPEAAVEPNTLLFVGALDWFPNQDGVVYFAETILPLLRAQQPDCRLRVVGRRPSPALARRLQGLAGVELVGEVADVRPYMAAAALLVVPLRVGGGSRIKIIESLAMDKAVVATTVGAEGLQAVSGTHLLLADTPEQFARAGALLLQAPAQAQRLGRAGGRWARQTYNWDDCARALEAAWRGSLDPLRFPLGGAR
jgi:glycosyltransferase involved in cell wall biosynthesis